MSILGVFGDDVDDGIDGICSPDGSARASDDFDPFNILEQCVLDLPINTGEQRRINAPAVDYHEYRSGQGASKSAHPQGPRVGIDPSDFNSGYETQGFRNAGCTGTPDVFLCNDVNRCRSAT